MKIEVNNNTDLPNKYIRLVKWRIYGLKNKFDHLIYSSVHINLESSSPAVYQVTLILGIPGHDVVLKDKSSNIESLFAKMTKKAHRYLIAKKNKSGGMYATSFS